METLNGHKMGVQLYKRDYEGGYIPGAVYMSIASLVRAIGIDRQRITRAINKAINNEIVSIPNTQYGVRELTTQERIEIFKRQGVM